MMCANVGQKGNVIGMREKLIELMTGLPCHAKTCMDCEFFNTEECYRRQREIIADHLIANGVTIPVRCKDCKRAQQYEADHEVFCYFIGAYMGNNNFCSYGERRTDDCT